MATMWPDTEPNIIKTIKEEVQFYFSVVKKYFRSYSDVNFLDRELNTSPNENRILSYNPIHTSFLAIIVDRLANNAKLPDLICFYKTIVEKHNIAFVEEYDLLEKYLIGMK